MARRNVEWPELGQRLRWFTARFDGECDSCGDDIYATDTIARTPDVDYICESCGEDEDADR